LGRRESAAVGSEMGPDKLKEYAYN